MKNHKNKLYIIYKKIRTKLMKKFTINKKTLFNLNNILNYLIWIT